MDLTSIVDTIQGTLPWTHGAAAVLIVLLLAEAIMVAAGRVGALLVESISETTGRSPRKETRRRIIAWGQLAALTIAIVLTIGLLI